MKRRSFIKAAAAAIAVFTPAWLVAKKKPDINNGYISIRIIINEPKNRYTVMLKYSHKSGKKLEQNHICKYNHDTIDLRPLLSEFRGFLLTRGITDYEIQNDAYLEYA